MTGYQTLAGQLMLARGLSGLGVSIGGNAAARPAPMAYHTRVIARTSVGLGERVDSSFQRSMARDYKHSHRTPERTPQPLWGGILIGLLAGLIIAAGVHVYDRRQDTGTASRDPAPTAVAPPPKVVAKPKAENPEPPFEFYDRLRTLEVVIPENEREVSRLPPPKKGEKARVYMLQAGSFHNISDAERVRAQLALQGVQASIQKVAIDNDVWHRVRVGPISDPDQLVRTRNKLRAANIDSLVLLLGE